MGVQNWLGDKLERLRAWARSVPPDVWIGLAIAAATLLVVWLAYRHASGSSSSGLGSIDPIIGAPPGGGSGAPGSIAPPGTFIPPPPALWGPPSGGGDGGASGGGLNGLAGGHSPEIARQQKQSADLRAYTASAAQIAAGQHAGAVVHSNDIHTASVAAAARTAKTAADQHAGAITHSNDIHSTATAKASTPPSPIAVTYHAGILSSAAYAPAKQAKNDAGIY